MSQLDSLRELDVEIAVALLSEGFADLATYTPPSGSATAQFTVLVDRGVLTTGFDSGVVQAETRITVYRVDIDAPAYGGNFTLASGEQFTIDKAETFDESLTVCIVSPYTAPPADDP